MGVRKKELGAWHKNGREGRERKCNHNAVQSTSRSPRRERWVRERTAAPNIANKALCCPEKLLYPHILCCAKPHSHLQNSFNVVHTLCPLQTFHTLLHMHDRQSQKHVPRLLTNLHVLVQRSWRCAREVYVGPSLFINFSVTLLISKKVRFGFREFIWYTTVCVGSILEFWAINLLLAIASCATVVCVCTGWL